MRFLIRTRAWVVGQVPGWGHARGNQSMFLLHINVSSPPFPPLFPSSFSLPSPFSKIHINKILKKPQKTLFGTNVYVIWGGLDVSLTHTQYSKLFLWPSSTIWTTDVTKSEDCSSIPSEAQEPSWKEGACEVIGADREVWCVRPNGPGAWRNQCYLNHVALSDRLAPYLSKGMFLHR